MIVFLLFYMFSCSTVTGAALIQNVIHTTTLRGTTRPNTGYSLVYCSSSETRLYTMPLCVAFSRDQERSKYPVISGFEGGVCPHDWWYSKVKHTTNMCTTLPACAVLTELMASKRSLMLTLLDFLLSVERQRELCLVKRQPSRSFSYHSLQILRYLSP